MTDISQIPNPVIDTDEQAQLRKVAYDLGSRYGLEYMRSKSDAGETTDELWTEAGRLGLLGVNLPEEYGGGGAGMTELAIVEEELSAAGAGLLMMVVSPAINGTIISKFGTEEQKQRWLPDLVAGTHLAGFGLTEPGAGSDAGGTQTTAALEDGQWRINGAKEFITNSGTDITSLVTVTAVTGTVEGRTGHDGRPAKEISTILVPAGTEGFSVAKAYDKVGWNSSDTHALHFTDARVPEENLLGARGRGFAHFLEILDEGRIAIAALATGAAQGCVDESVAYAKQRTSFGQKIGQFQAVSFKIARMQARAHAARLAYYEAAQKMLAGKPFKTEAAMAKLIAGEAAMDNARDATQVFGGYGFMNETLVARHYRDSKILEVGEGTTEVQLMLIARELGL